MKTLNDDECVDNLTNFKAIINNQAMMEMEEYHQEMTPQRRLVMAVLSKDADKLFEMAESHMDTTKEMFEQAIDYMERLDTFKKLASTCCTRLMIVLAGSEDQSAFDEVSDKWAQAMKSIESE